MKKVFIALAVIATVVGTAPAIAQSLDQRSHNQEQRIRQGERSGQLTPDETRRLRFREMRMRRSEERMRWHNGGRLMPRQRHHLREMQQRDSRQIYRLKHNSRRY